MRSSSCKNIVAIYCRLSKEDLDKDGEKTISESIKNQKRMLEDYAIKQGWRIYEVYIDEDYGGSDRDRPEFNRLITDSLFDHFNIVLCKKQARFARDIEYVEKYIHGLFAERQIRFVALLDNIDTGSVNRSSKKASQINSLVDEWYLADLSDNITSSFDAKRRAGEFIGSWAPYGYKKDPKNTNQLIIDEPAAIIVREIFDLYLQGNGIAKIAEILSKRGVLSPYAYMLEQGENLGRKGITTKSAIWSPNTIATILDRQTYIGDMVQGKFKKASYKSKKLLRVPKNNWTITTQCHEPVIDLETWELVREIRRNKVRPTRKGTVNIFASKLRCMQCGELMHAVNYSKVTGNVRSKTEFNTSFRCSKKFLQKDSCKGSSISMNKLEEFVLSEINNLSKMYFDDGVEIAKLVKLSSGREDKLDHLKRQVQKLHKSLGECDKALKSLYFDKVDGIVTESQFIDLNNQINRDKEKYEHAIPELESEIQALIEKNEKKQNMIELIQKYRKLDKLTREIINELIEVVCVGKKDNDTGERIIKIVWNI